MTSQYTLSAIKERIWAKGHPKDIVVITRFQQKSTDLKIINLY